MQGDGILLISDILLLLHNGSVSWEALSMRSCLWGIVCVKPRLCRLGVPCLKSPIVFSTIDLLGLSKGLSPYG